MVNYTCYRCGYTTHIKTLMVRHFSRKHSCDAKINDIKIDVCKEYILKGISYQDYLEEINKVSNGFKPDGIGFKQDGMVQNSTFLEQNGTFLIQNETKKKYK